jgi:hypothetical protein
MAVSNTAQPAATIEADNVAATAQMLEAGTQEKNHVVENIEKDRDATTRAKQAPAAGIMNYFVSSCRSCKSVTNSRRTAGVHLWHEVGLLTRCLKLPEFDSIRHYYAVDDSHIWYDQSASKRQPPINTG